jgi:hypothetical protein
MYFQLIYENIYYHFSFLFCFHANIYNKNIFTCYNFMEISESSNIT